MHTNNAAITRLTVAEMREHFDDEGRKRHDSYDCEVCDGASLDEIRLVHTNATVLENLGINTDSIEHLDLEMPIISGNQRQGDVFLLEITRDMTKDAKLITKAGVVVVRAETNSANTHALHTLTGECLWLPNAHADQELTQGWLTVSDGAEATLVHTEEHSVLGIGAGTYEIKRQREFAGEWQRVAD